MKKIMISLMIIFTGFINCEFKDDLNCMKEYIEYRNIGLDYMTDYDFPNDIQIETFEDALEWVALNITYKKEKNHDCFSEEQWQLPEETYKLRTGDCEDFSLMLGYLLNKKLGLQVNLVRGQNHWFIDCDYGYIEPQSGFFVNDLINKEDMYTIRDIIDYRQGIWMTYHYGHRVGRLID